MILRPNFRRISLYIFVFLIFLSCLCNSCDGVVEGTVTLQPPGGASPDCVQMLSSFAIASGNFTYCTISNARPITLCRECIKSYLKVSKIYKEILKLKDRGGESCKDELINLDRLQAVDAGFKYVTGLWARANCDSCFKFDEKGQPSLTIAVKEILNASSVLDNCINTYRNGSAVPDIVTCKACMDDYLKVNNLYNQVKADNGDINFCMDIIDLINATRSQWSGKLGCCNDRRKPEFIFLLSSAGVTILSVLFYILAFAFTSKKEQKLAQQNRWSQKEAVSDSNIR